MLLVHGNADILFCSQSHIKSHHLLCNRRESLYSRLEKQCDPTIVVVAQEGRIYTVHKVDDSTHVVWQLKKTIKQIPV